MENQKNMIWINLFQEINTFMEINQDKWSSIGEIRKSYDAFINNLKKLKDLQPQLEKDLSPVENELEDNRKLLLEKLFPLTNIFEVYSLDHQPGKKAGRLLISRKKLNKSGIEELLDHASGLYKHLVKLSHEPDNSVKGINGYGLDTTMLDELNTAIHQLQSAQKLKKDILIYIKKTRIKSDELIKSNRNLLKNRLNKLMSVFTVTHPSMYREYQSIAIKK